MRPQTAEPPQFDNKRYCRAIAANGGGEPSVSRGCLEHEALAREQVSADVPDAIRSRCTQQAMTNGGSYMLFNGCVKMAEERAGRPQLPERPR
jgi:hypothetical protein